MLKLQEKPLPKKKKPTSDIDVYAIVETIKSLPVGSHYVVNVLGRFWRTGKLHLWQAPMSPKDDIESLKIDLWELIPWVTKRIWLTVDDKEIVCQVEKKKGSDKNT